MKPFCRFNGFAANLLCAFFLGGCASDGVFHEIPAGQNVGVPRFLELREERAVATLHFPRGVYALDGADRTGFYYRAPRQIIMHSFAGSMPHEGGIFVHRASREKLRGYVLWAGELRKVGNFAKTKHEFRN
jgi:hypothetical protein